jgi:uncharacterized protein (DUF342 family)
MLNWRRDPDYEQRMKRYEQRRMLHEQRMKQLRSETEQLRRENARQRALSALIKQHCFPDDSSSTPIPPTAPDSSSS